MGQKYLVHDSHVESARGEIPDHQQAHQAVVQFGEQARDEWIGTGGTRTHDESGPLAPEIQHLSQHVRGILEVGRQVGEAVPSDIPQPGLDRRHRPPVREMVEDDGPGTPALDLAQPIQRAIARTVIDEDQLDAGVDRRQPGLQLPDRLGQGVERALVEVDRHHD